MSERQDKTPAGNRPRYTELAETLVQSIGNGTYPVGSHLPTEAELQRRHGMSRFTVRAALKQLQDQGLIRRRPRLGTEVIAERPTALYKETSNSIDELLAHGEEVWLEVDELKDLVVDRKLATYLGYETGTEVLRVSGVRHLMNQAETEGPLCAITVWLDARYEALRDRLHHMRGSIASLVEQEFAREIHEVYQTVEAGTLGAELATRLNAAEGSPALILHRRFWDGANELFEVSRTTFPASRFTFEMRFSRNLRRG